MTSYTATLFRYPSSRCLRICSPLKSVSALRPDRRIILYCGSGGRSALAAKTLHDMGYSDVASLAGGYAAWRKAQDG